MFQFLFIILILNYTIRNYYYDSVLLLSFNVFYFNRHKFLKTGKPKKIRHNIINNQFILIGVIRDESSYLIVVFLKFPMPRVSFFQNRDMPEPDKDNPVADHDSNIVDRQCYKCHSYVLIHTVL